MLKFILKGLFRDSSRSKFPIMTIAAGTFFTVFLYSYLQGVLGDLVHTSAVFSTGHVKVMTRAYEELSQQVPNDLAILNVKTQIEKLKKIKSDINWTPRIRFGGLFDIPDEKGETRSQAPVFGLGVNLIGKNSPEIAILNLQNALVRGNLPKNKNEILISDEFAKSLGVNIGGSATLLSSTMNGGMAMHNFKIAGTVHFGIMAMDKSAVIADIADLQFALDMPDGASEIVGYSKDMVYSNETMLKFASEFNEQYSKEEDEFSPIMLALSRQNGLADFFGYINVAGSIIVFVFIGAMGLVLWNSGLMNGIRRYGEIGIRLAMGEPKGDLYRSMIVESICTGIAGSIVGTLIGLGASYYLQYYGLDIGNLMKNSSMLINNIIRARVTATSYVIGFLPGVFAPVLGTMIAGIGIYRRQTSQLFKELEV